MSPSDHRIDPLDLEELEKRAQVIEESEFRRQLRLDEERDQKLWEDSFSFGESPKEKCAREAAAWAKRQKSWQEEISLRLPKRRVNRVDT